MWESVRLGDNAQSAISVGVDNADLSNDRLVGSIICSRHHGKTDCSMVDNVMISDLRNDSNIFIQYTFVRRLNKAWNFHQSVN